ncbi:MAG: sigma-70 family RNA polymerase sigma factor [Myxococcaceae bacterium]|nr:sigma-70 family RNA polymerase sigma factor [Myxococcaceae bacterium]
MRLIHPDLSPALIQERPAAAESPRASPTLEEVYRQYGPTVVRWALRLGGPSIDVDDVVQDVFLRVHKSLGGFRGDAHLATWLFQITRNVVGHRRRKERWHQWLGGSACEVAGHLPSLGPTAVDDVERRDAAKRLYRVLDMMSEKYRTVFILFEMERLSGEEIAKVMEAKVETVWVWLHRARAQFQKHVEQLRAREER